MPAPKGNDNAGDGRRWREAIRRALARAQGNIDRGLDSIADRVIAAAAAGSPWAVEHIAERMDGKSAQYVHIEQELTVNVGEAEGLSPRLDKLRSLRQGNTVQ